MSVAVDQNALIEGERTEYGASYGKLMMWFFLVSDAFTFTSLLVSYGAIRFNEVLRGFGWPNPEEVFHHAPILHEVYHMNAPLVFVGIMTFILIVSSVTMVLAVEAGHRKVQKEVATWMLWTVLGGATFLGCQAYEWYHFITGSEHGAILMADGRMAQFVKNGHDVNTKQLVMPDNGKVLSEAESAPIIAKGKVIKGANMLVNEYGPKPFANFFFFVTGFHGTHVFSGVLINFIIYLNVLAGTYEKRGHYEMVEKVGLYWHFVDLVWVFVFTFFYLV